MYHNVLKNKVGQKFIFDQEMQFFFIDKSQINLP